MRFQQGTYDERLLPPTIIDVKAMDKRTAHPLKMALQIAQEFRSDESIAT